MTVFITKFNPAGSSLIWSTYLGGTSNDQAKSIAIDPARNVYLTGFTNSDDYPMWLPYQPTLSGTTDAFVTKINAAGTALVYSTYLGGGIGDEGYDIAADSVGNAYVTGSTDSNTFPVWNAYQPSYGGLNDAFFAKFGPAGTIGFASYLGGSWPDVGMAVAVNGAGEMYLYGSTQSETFPTAHPIFPTLRGSEDAFITRFNAAGNTIIFSTFFGGTDNRELQTSGAMTIDAAGNIYFTGSTESSDYPTTANAYQPFRASPVDAFVSRISESDPTPTPNPPTPTPVICVLGNYSITQTTGATIVPGTTLVPNSDCNDCTAPMVLPFPVQFYDQTFTQARASSNGNLQFTSDNSLPFNSCLPNPQLQQHHIRLLGRPLPGLPRRLGLRHLHLGQRLCPQPHLQHRVAGPPQRAANRERRIRDTALREQQRALRHNLRPARQPGKQRHGGRAARHRFPVHPVLCATRASSARGCS